MDLKFDMPKVKSSIIKVLGVGGGGGNAVNHMFNQGIKGVDFIVCNTDAQALELSPIPNKIQIGSNLTEGRGAGSKPEVGRNAALEDLEEIKKILETNTKMLFITAGMGGGTGTGAAPIIARAAKDAGILTVGIVTTPFNFEGKKRGLRAVEGIKEMSESVDTLLVIENQKLGSMFSNLTLSSAFSHADNILTTAAKGIAEIITVPGYINVDFEDVKTVMADSGAAIMGSAEAEGEDRAQKAVEEAVNSPLLSGNNINGAKYILLNISSGQSEVLMDEITTITDFITEEAGVDVDMIWGNSYDENLGDNISVTIIATAFDNAEERIIPDNEDERAASNDAEKKRQKRLEQMSLFADKKTKNKEPELDEVETPSGESEIEDNTSTPNQEELSPDAETKSSKDSEKLKGISFNIKNQGDLDYLERTPAYKRKNIKLKEIPHSSEVEISRFSLEEDEKDGKPKIRENNSYLNNDVD